MLRDIEQYILYRISPHISNHIQYTFSTVYLYLYDCTTRKYATYTNICTYYAVYKLFHLYSMYYMHTINQESLAGVTVICAAQAAYLKARKFRRSVHWEEYGNARETFPIYSM